VTRLQGWGLVLFASAAVGATVFHDEINHALEAPERARAEQEQLKKTACGYNTANILDYRECRAKLELGIK
jgi:hypothetical protein